jgi:hypothetical protein
LDPENVLHTLPDRNNLLVAGQQGLRGIRRLLTRMEVATVATNTLMSDAPGYLISGGTGASQGVRDRRTELATRLWLLDTFATKQAHPAIVDAPTWIPPFDQERRS